MTKMLFDSKYIIFLLCTLLFPSVYNEGDTVSLMHQNQSFQVCSGEYYTESVSLADFNGDLNGGHNTVILIDMSASWWQYCPDLQTQVGLVEEHYEDNPNVIVITALSDIGQPYSCSQWNNFSPNVTALIIEDNNSIFNWFNSQNGFPSTVFIDENMTVQYKANYLNSYYMKGYIDDLLGDCGDDCVSEPSPALFEYAIDGLTVSFIDLSQDINVSVITDWHWDFGDGIESTQQFPEHTYSNSGTYYVVLNIVDQYGADGLEYWEYITLEGDDSCGADAGDVTGDGNLNILDIVQVANYILGVSIPDFECAADLNNDENVNILDIVQIANAILDR